MALQARDALLAQRDELAAALQEAQRAAQEGAARFARELERFSGGWAEAERLAGAPFARACIDLQYAAL